DPPAPRRSWRLDPRMQVHQRPVRRRGATPGDLDASRSHVEEEDPRRLTIWVVEQFLQAFGEPGCKARRPGRVDETDADHVAQVRSILIAPRPEFHAYERIKIHHLKLRGPFRFIEARRWLFVIRSHLLSAK